MTRFKMKFKLPVFAAIMSCCISCVTATFDIGGNLLPLDQRYLIYSEEACIDSILMDFPDSLSGYSQTRITVGAIRDEHFGLTTRSAVVTLIPLYDTLDFGENPKVMNFHFAAGKDTINCLYEYQKRTLQNVNVYSLLRPLASNEYDLTTPVEHGTELICKGTPVINGIDSLSFNFTESYASRYLNITQEDLDSLDLYLQKFPGIYIETDAPAGYGGRINCFNLQLGFDSDYYMLSGNYATMTIETLYDHWDSRSDTTFYFYYCANDFHDLDSLFTNSSTGSFPQYCRSVASHETIQKKMAGKAEDVIFIEGGGGLKPRIPAMELRRVANELISKQGVDPKDVVLNKATIELPFEFPEDYKDMDLFPYKLSPTCRLMTDTSAVFIGLADSSSEEENQGDIDRSNLMFAPDITYHLQELLKIKDTDTEKMKRLKNGSYDIWLLIMANEVITESSSSSSSDEMSEYYQYLAYQSYYNNMYGGYGSYGSNSYSNYYTYMMLAQMYGSSGTTTSTTEMLDKDRYYYGHLNGPKFDGRVPKLKLTFSVPIGDVIE